MANYGAYTVDPWAGARQAENAMNTRRQLNMQKERNALAQARFGEQQRQNAFNNSMAANANQRAQTGLAEQQKQNAFNRSMAGDANQRANQDKAEELIKKQANILGAALESVNDEQSYQGFKSFVNQISQSPLGQTRFMQYASSQLPESYDQEFVERSKQFLGQFMDKKPSEPNKTREIKSGKNIVTQEWDGGKWSDIAKSPRFKPSDATKKTGYSEDTGKQVDDNRSFYSQKARLLIDPETQLIRPGPAGNPDKYVKEYGELMKQMESDQRKITQGKKPSWMEEKKEKTKSTAVDQSGKQIRDGVTGTYNGRKVVVKNGEWVFAD